VEISRSSQSPQWGAYRLGIAAPQKGGSLTHAIRAHCKCDFFRSPAYFIQEREFPSNLRVCNQYSRAST
jgi:hypothetical protein